jgi:hypothetical protein
VQTVPCSLANADADALNRESGRHSTTTMVWHYRISRRTGAPAHRRTDAPAHRPRALDWLSTGAAERLEDYRGGPTTLHGHSRA